VPRQARHEREEGGAAPAAAAIADVSRVRALLVAAAQQGRALTYGEALACLGLRFSRPRMRALCRTLDRIDTDAAAAGEPELAVLVVRQSDGLPGQGWWTGHARDTGYAGAWTGPQATRIIARLHARTFTFWSLSPEQEEAVRILDPD